MAETDASLSSNKRMPLKEELLSRELIFDFICCHKLGKSDYRSNTKAAATLRKVGQELEEANKAFFNEAAKKLSVTAPVFNDIADEVFREGINWGRIVSLYCFAGVLAVSLRDNHISDGEDVARWLSEYMCRKEMAEWIAKAGGWNGFCEFFKISPGINKELFGGWTFVTTMLASIAAVLLVAHTNRTT